MTLDSGGNTVLGARNIGEYVLYTQEQARDIGERKCKVQRCQKMQRMPSKRAPVNNTAQVLREIKRKMRNVAFVKTWMIAHHH